MTDFTGRGARGLRFLGWIRDRWWCPPRHLALLASAAPKASGFRQLSSTIYDFEIMGVRYAINGR
jgi:hypothetical protein